MKPLDILFLVITGIAAITAIISLVLYSRRKKDIEQLAQSIDSYIENGKAIDFSTKDDCFAPLQNNISDLQNLLELEKSNTATESQKNAEFIADISHQLKTPLSGLRLYCEMENTANPTAHTVKELQLIEKMENLIYQLLRLEKIKSDTYTMDFQFYKAEDIIENLINDFKPLFPQKRYICSGSSTVRCDKAWISEAIGNLIKNASEHTENNGTITIKIENGEKSTLITVSDNGGGVPADELPKLFTRFHKTENALPGSAGIGLAITKAIVEKHHGTITAENKDNGLAVAICLAHIDGYITI